VRQTNPRIYNTTSDELFRPASSNRLKTPEGSIQLTDPSTQKGRPSSSGESDQLHSESHALVTTGLTSPFNPISLHKKKSPGTELKYDAQPERNSPVWAYCGKS
jgi:hypothetical protein